MFDSINARSELGNGEFNLENFLYYFTLWRSSSNNKPVRSPKKKKAPKRKTDKGKGKPKADEPTHPNYYEKWQIFHNFGTLWVFQGANKMKFLTTFKVGGKY